MRLTDRQQQAMDLLTGPQRHTLLRGGSRSGKTFALVLAVVARALRVPESRHAILRFRFNAARASISLDTLPKVMRTCFPGVPIKEYRQDGFFEFPNGSQLWIGGLDDKDRVEKILGQEYATIYLNECSQIPWSSVVVAQTRLAQSIEGLAQRAYYDMNPTGTGHWTYQMFVEGQVPGTERRKLPDPDNYASMVMNPGDNLENLDPAYIASLDALPERHRKRFLLGEFVNELENALWTIDQIERNRVDMGQLPELTRVVVGVDPSGAAGDEDERSDEIGVVVAAKGADNHAYVLADATLRAKPEVWGRVACEQYDAWKADAIVAEKNFGGDMVRAIIDARPGFHHVKLVTASRGKVVRAEPISALYERGLVHHAGAFPDLEDQLAQFTTAGYTGERSPDRADAAVWALTELMGSMINTLPEDFSILQNSFVAPLETASSPWDSAL